MPADIRSSDVFLKSDLRNMFDGVERMRPDFRECLDALRVQLGIHVDVFGGPRRNETITVRPVNGRYIP